MSQMALRIRRKQKGLWTEGEVCLKVRRAPPGRRRGLDSVTKEAALVAGVCRERSIYGGGGRLWKLCVSLRRCPGPRGSKAIRG